MSRQICFQHSDLPSSFSDLIFFETEAGPALGVMETHSIVEDKSDLSAVGQAADERIQKARSRSGENIFSLSTHADLVIAQTCILEAQ